MGKRALVRHKYGIAEDPNDFLVTWCCARCAMCQEAREMNTRGTSSTTYIINEQPKPFVLTPPTITE
ncbi:unnamed protein product [Didymodactylos carnosus]|uniref:Uncharacterized protein n=1 Tax=Didymodactylos carnosus TaxID=1234261 RepID=A0A814UA46_9BILA|nr:unnamed protein product [Didymodactylos carnosus]CAF1628008.1 unnamed protein product [Didymodactylos carnosus]CAF3933053.1 unnamed protein product [Didymodactylos carnosus]CAF4452224.1 unnamed protein product [Didymodactylos carnosus]